MLNTTYLAGDALGLSGAQHSEWQRVGAWRYRPGWTVVSLNATLRSWAA
jgi:hypothetical protein